MALTRLGRVERSGAALGGKNLDAGRRDEERFLGGGGGRAVDGRDRPPVWPLEISPLCAEIEHGFDAGVSSVHAYVKIWGSVTLHVHVLAA